MKLIGITQRMRYISEINENRDEIDNRLISLVSFCGFHPVPIPNSLDQNLENWLKRINIEALLLSGGDDIGKYPLRDQTEMKLLDFARDNRLSVLGICRGMQMIGHWAGTGLHKVENHNKTMHRIYGRISKNVNSYHSYSLKECPKNFEILAKSSDDQIEAIRHLDYNWEGWMWHPEREKFFLNSDTKNLKILFGSSYDKEK